MKRSAANPQAKFLKILVALGALLALGLPGAGQLRSQTALAPNLRDLMTAAEFHDYGLSGLSQAQLAGLNSWFSSFIANLLAENRNTTAIASKDFPALEDATIVAEDGQRLGKITLGEFDPDSIVNELGHYGSFVGSISMFNPKSPYGGTLSRFSPFNPHTSTPPKIFKGGRFVAYLSVNEMKAPRIDPYMLVGWIRINQ